IGLALALFMVPPTIAQDKSSTDSAVVPNVALSSGQVAPTPEMWFYEQQMREYLDPKLSLRRVIEQRSAERRARLAAMKWYGYSNLRPVAGPDPYNSEYSPSWGGNNSLYPYRWRGYGPAWMVQQPANRNY
ncbi:MAG: hypothetical protein GX621_15320, partial [Pirellulaceae bacterium]|nr:hypothetical protein [Pirellulaceae bacterium]